MSCYLHSSDLWPDPVSGKVRSLETVGPAVLSWLWTCQDVGPVVSAWLLILLGLRTRQQKRGSRHQIRNGSNHKTKIFSNLEDNYFDLIIAFTKEAYDEAVNLKKTEACEIELLNIPDASQTTGNRQQRLDSYRSVRDLLIEKLQNRFKEML